MTKKQALRVLISEDHYLVREGLVNILTAHDIEVVDQAVTAEETLEKCRAHEPDVILLDLNLADAGRIDLIDKILQDKPDTKILIYSMRKAIETIDAAYKHGARGYVTKDTGPDLILAGVLAVASGQYYYMPGIADAIAKYNASRKSELDPRLALSKTELDVFLKLAQGTSVEETAMAMGVKVKTVSNYVLTISKKLKCREMDFTSTAIRHGLLTPTF